MKPAATAKNAQNPLYAPNTASATATIPSQQEALTSRSAGRPNQPPPARAAGQSRTAARHSSQPNSPLPPRSRRVERRRGTNTRGNKHTRTTKVVSTTTNTQWRRGGPIEASLLYKVCLNWPTNPARSQARSSMLTHPNPYRGVFAFTPLTLLATSRSCSTCSQRE